jgi:hypothetical protein
MKIVALVKPPPDAAAAAVALAAATGSAAAEARMRLAPEPPALLARLAPEAADALAGQLRGIGLAALAIDETGVGAHRILVRSLELRPESVVFTSRAGESEELAFAEVLCILRGSSAVRESSERTEKVTKFSPVKAALGVGLTSTHNRTVRGSQEDVEQSIYVFAGDGRAALLRETALEFTCLGKAMGPSRTANMGALAQLLKKGAPQAFYDERLLRLGRRPLPFVIGGEMHISVGAKVSQTRTDTAGGIDVLAEVLRAAVAEKLLP